MKVRYSMKIDDGVGCDTLIRIERNDDLMPNKRVMLQVIMDHGTDMSFSSLTTMSIEDTISLIGNLQDLVSDFKKGGDTK